MCRGRDEAEDLFQETWVKVFRFYEGDSFAYMELRDESFENLTVVFEDYRTKKLICTTHYAKDSSTMFSFEIDYSNNNVVQKPLSAKGNIQSFREAAWSIEPAKLDYAEYIKDGKIDEEKIKHRTYNKENILNLLQYYHVQNVSGIYETRQSKNKEHIGEFLDLFFSKPETTYSSEETDTLKELYILRITITKAYENLIFQIQPVGGKYYISTHFQTVSITESECAWFKQWLKQA